MYCLCDYFKSGQAGMIKQSLSKTLLVTLKNKWIFINTQGCEHCLNFRAEERDLSQGKIWL